jgi:CBS domain-containing protein
MNVLELSLKKVITDHDLITCTPEMSLGNVIELMISKDIGSVCIVDYEGLTTGIFTERDFLKKVGTKAGPECFAKPNSKFMTPDPVNAKDDAKIRTCFGLMRMGKFRHLIINDDSGKPVRMISIRDAFYFLCDSIK